MMQPSGRAMHNGKLYELWGDELWEYAPDSKTGTTIRKMVGKVGPPIHSDIRIRDAASDMLAALEELVASNIYAPITRKQWRQIYAAIAKARGISQPTGNPKYPDSRNGVCEDSDSMHDCESDTDCIHDCDTGCHPQEGKA